MISGMIRAARSMTTTAASARISGVSSEGRPRDAPRSKEQKRQAQQRAKDPARRTGVKRARTALAEVRMAGSGGAWRCETRGFIGNDLRIPRALRLHRADPLDDSDSTTPRNVSSCTDPVRVASFHPSGAARDCPIRARRRVETVCFDFSGQCRERREDRWFSVSTCTAYVFVVLVSHFRSRLKIRRSASPTRMAPSTSRNRLARAVLHQGGMGGSAC